MTRLLLASALLLVASGCWLPDSGGCPWTETSAVVVDPSTGCLDLEVADASGQSPSTGCVNPVLFGTNTCDATLLLPAGPQRRGDDMEVAPGETFAYEVSLEHAVEEPDDHYRFVIEAHLGENALRVEFTTWRE